jgi:LysM repeat protein
LPLGAQPAPVAAPTPAPTPSGNLLGQALSHLLAYFHRPTAAPTGPVTEPSAAGVACPLGSILPLLAAPPTKPKTASATTYQVEAGDSLSAIAADQLGDAGRWREIYDLNRDQVADPNRIYPGQVLKLPADAESEAEAASWAYAKPEAEPVSPAPQPHPPVAAPKPTTPGPTVASVPQPAKAPPRAEAATLGLKGLATGQTFSLSGRYQGYSISGDARVARYDGHHLELDLALSAAMGFYTSKAKLVLDTQPDGTVRFTAAQLDHERKQTTDSLRIVSQRDGNLDFVAPDGKPVTLRTDGAGSMSISYDGTTMQLAPAGASS